MTFRLKVVLVVPEFTGSRAGSENLGISYIEAALCELDYVDCVTINRNCTLTSAQIAEAIRREEPDLLGVSITTYELLASLAHLTDVLSELTCPIVVGGHYATFVAAEIMREFEHIDVCVVGEGEGTIIDLANAVHQGTEISQVPGIAYRNGDDILLTPQRRKIESLDELPFPKRDQGLVVYSLAGSRGCYTTCSFCSVPQFFKLIPGRNFRMRSVDNIGKEIGLLKEIGARAVSFVDDVFLIPGQRGLERAKSIADVMALSGMKWAFGCRTPELTEEIVAYCAPRGLCNIGLGLESGSERVLERLSKRASLSASENAIAICRKYDISIQPYFIMFEPDMSLADLEDNIYFLWRLGLLWPTFASNELDPYPGTPAYNELRTSGRLSERRGRMIATYKDERLSRIKESIQIKLRSMIPAEISLRRQQFEYELAGRSKEPAEIGLRDLSNRVREEMLSCIE